MKASDYILIFAGVGILASVPIIMATDSFALWTIAKVSYGVGVLFALWNT